MMRRSVSASLLLHAAVLLGGFAVLPEALQKPVAEETPIVIDISNIGDQTVIKAETKKDVPKTDKPKAEATETTKDVMPAPEVDKELIEHAKVKEPPPEEKVEPQKAEDKPVEDTKLEELLKAQAEEERKAAEEAELALKKKQEAEEKKKQEAEEKKKQEAEKKAAEAKKKAEEKKAAEAAKKKAQKLDVAALEDLLQDKSQEKRTAPKKSADETGNPDQGQNEAQGDAAEAKASMRAAIEKRIAECYSAPPASVVEGVRVVISMDFTLNADGTLKAFPQAAQTGDYLTDAVSAAAASAIIECQPYNFFPAGKYKGYARWIINFDPSKFTG